jgi:rare lipoprotein A (peptidoglycan hydrolase)
MTRDRIVEISKKAASRVADQKAGTRPKSKKYVTRLAELKKRRDTERAAAVETQRLRA